MTDRRDLIASFAELIAKDDSHGYSQVNRWGNPDYDCSSLAISAAEYAGIPVKGYGATYTGNMVSAFTKAGFRAISYGNDKKLIRGDILLNTVHHAAIYVGDNKLVEACIDESGSIQGKTPGDQTGHEIHSRLMYNYPWEYILRWPESDPSPDPPTPPGPEDPDCSYTAGNSVVIYGPELKYKDYGPAVAAAQGAINYHGFGPIEINGFFSTRMRDAVKKLQQSKHISVDGIIGPQTWRALMYWR